MSSGVIKRPGRAPTRSEQLLLVPLIPLKYYPAFDEVVVIHHITEDTTHRLQLEIERRVSRHMYTEARSFTVTKCFFERVWI